MSESINNDELDALIKLLDDPDEGIYSHIKDKILAYGDDVIPILETAWESSFDELLQGRIEEIIHQIQFSAIVEGLRKWVKLGGRNLLTASVLICKYQYPDIEQKDLEEKIEQIKRDVWIELNNNLTALEKIKVINHILYEVHGFSGNRKNVNAPQNSFLNNVLDSKKGNPLSLSLLYAIIAQDLDLPIQGVDLPEYFILAYLDEDSLLPPSLKDETNVLFYINTFSKGSIFGRKEIDLFLKQLKIEPQNDHYFTCPNIQFIRRLISHLIRTFDKLGSREKVDELNELLAVLEEKE